MQTQVKILAVDDDPNNIAILEELLEDHYDLKTSSNGEQALEIAPAFLPDVILLDIMMPGMDGYEATRQIREIPQFQALPILAVTAKAMKDDRDKCLEAGTSDYISKPVDIDKLLSMLRVWLHN